MTPNATTSASATFFRTARGKTLIGLAAATGIVLILTIFALLRDARLSASDFVRAPVFPNLAVQLADAASVSIAAKTGTIEIVHSGDVKTGRWVVPTAHGYPASIEHLRRLFLGLADLEAVEKKTARPDWFGALSLDDPKTGGSAIAVTVKDSKGDALAALLVGKLKPPTPGGRPMVYIRRTGENQTYLAAGDLPLETERKAWLDDRVVDIARDRVKRVTVAPSDAAAYSVSRVKPDQPDFTLDNIPKGREPLSNAAANPTGAAAVDLTLDDVRPASEVDFSKASHFTIETFDGLTAALDVTDKDELTYIRVTAQGQGADAAKEADAINARLRGWAYAVPSWKATIFRKPLDQLLKSPEKPGKKPKE